MINSLLFYVFSFVLLFSALMVISVRSPVHSVLFLIVAFFNAAGLFMLLNAEFLSMILIIVYVGAVAVLFLFVVMMLDMHFTDLIRTAKSHWPLGLSLGGILLAEIVMILLKGLAVGPTPSTPVTELSPLSNTHQLGEILYTKYFLLFQLSGLILLVAMIGAIVLTLRQRTGVRRQKISTQNQRRAKDVLEVKKVKSGQGVNI